MQPAANEPDRDDLNPAKSHLDFPVVGIGASAGGLSALQRLFAAMPPDSGMAFIVVMHLSPDHESSLGAILQRASPLPVVTVSHSQPVQPDHVYVISPAKKLTMVEGELRVTDMPSQQARHHSIDLFFRTLAVAHQERAVGVVLSGSGADGAQGLKRIKELGGVTIAHSLEDAEFDSMPRAAVATGLVDFVLPVAEMPAKLVSLWQNAKRIQLPKPPANLFVSPAAGDAELLAEEALLSIMALLRERTGHNFSAYKRATVLRRLERRMQVNAMPDLPSYRRYLETEPNETSELLQDMLISVTNFFRDPDAFGALEVALKNAIGARAVAEPFRVWVVGCATGEEAYSVTITLRELLKPLGTSVQVFASDIDERAVAVGRTGAYPRSIATDVSAERLHECFVDDPVGFRIAKAVRNNVVFSVHNVISDPPFSRMDLICCRNLLIYLDRSAQAQLLRSFHFALKPRGLLFLGSSETTDAAEDLFTPQDKRYRVFHARQGAANTRTLPPLPAHTALRSFPAAAEPPKAEASRPILEVTHERALRNHGPPTVLVDADDTTLHVDERAAHLLRLPGGAPSNKLMALVRPELRAELRAALARAAETGKSVEARRVRLQINGKQSTVTVSVRPVADASLRGLYLVVFDESDESMSEDGDWPEGRDPVIASLELELMKALSDLNSTRGEAAASTEDLRASNEELQTINEELRSATEELETSKEELQAVNEELTTVNAELNLKIEETAKANDDLQNLMVSAEIGAVFVDRDMRVKRFTPQAATLFNLLASDFGRPLSDITHRLDYPLLEADTISVMKDLRRVEREVKCLDDGRWFLARLLPYRTGKARIDGTVLTFFDVTARRAMEESLRLSEQRMRLVAESMREYAIITTDAAGVVITWSAGAERVFGFTAEEAIGRPYDIIFTIEDRIAGVPAEELKKASEELRAGDDRWYLRKGGERIFVSGITTPLVDGGVLGYAKIARDFTSAESREREREAALQQERAERDRLQQASVMKDEFLAVMSHELKNPLAVIQMSAQLLARLPSFPKDPRADRAMRAIHSATVSQTQIINDLLELSRVNTGKVVLAQVAVDLSDLIRNIASAVGPDLQAKRLNLTLDLPESVTAMVDPVRTEQIVWNLLTNAIKFTPDFGDVRVSLVVEAGRAKLTVADSGIGIEPQFLDRVFEMFNQVDAGTSRKHIGLGIGLALVKQLAALHGGNAEATSAGPGHGAQFHVWLPLTLPPTEVAPASSEEPHQALSGMRILLVDDDALLLDAFTELLELNGAEIVAVDNATRALQVACNERFDVVLSDISMPWHDGYWLAEHLRSAPETRSIPVIAVSAMSREADRLKAMQAGFDAHVGKPLNLTELGVEIAAAIKKRAGLSGGAK